MELLIETVILRRSTGAWWSSKEPRLVEEQVKSWRETKMHGQFLKHLEKEVVDINGTWNWLQKAHLKSSKVKLSSVRPKNRLWGRIMWLSSMWNVHCVECVTREVKVLPMSLKRHSQLMHMRLRYHFLANLHITRHAHETEGERRIRNS